MPHKRKGHCMISTWKLNIGGEEKAHKDFEWDIKYLMVYMLNVNLAPYVLNVSCFEIRELK